MKRRKLTLKQQRFKDDYIRTGNATEAAARNYNTNRDVARRIGTENLSKPVIQEAIEEDLSTEDMNREWVLKGFKRHALQKQDKNVSLKAYELTSKTLGMLKEVRENRNDESIPDNPDDRARERDRLLERLAALHRADSSRRSIPVEPRDTGVQPNNGTATHAGMPIHRDVEQKEENASAS